MNATYWVVIWGDAIEDDPMSGPKDPQKEPQNLRVTNNRYDDAKTACRECWGMVSGNMWVRPFNTVQDMRINKRRAMLFDISNKNKWTRMHPTDKWSLNIQNTKE